MNYTELEKVADAIETTILDYDHWNMGSIPDAIEAYVEKNPSSDLKIMNGTTFGVRCRVPVFGVLYGWKAIENFFGLNDSQFKYLFCASSYTKDEYCSARVVRRIRDFCL